MQGHIETCVVATINLVDEVKKQSLRLNVCKYY